MSTRHSDPSQRVAINAESNCVISACPGSGKTTLIVTKVVKELDALRTSARGVLCITFTRAAVESIEEKLRAAIGDIGIPGCTVSTIHGFALKHILKPYAGLLGFDKPPRIITPSSSDYLTYAQAAVEGTFGNADQMRNVRRDRGGSPISSDLSSDVVQTFWSLLASVGLIDLPTLLFYALRILREHAWVVEALSAQYAWIIVDEYQDTNDSCIAMLEQIRDVGMSHFMLVGDPRQAIYGFAGVNTVDLKRFADSLSEDRISLSGSYRCGAAICRDGSRITPKSPSFSTNRDEADDHSITEFTVAGHTSTAIMEYYVPKLGSLGIPLSDAAILCARGNPLKHIGGMLREADFPITGAPTRQYNESLLSKFLEAFTAFARRPIAHSSRRLRQRLFEMIADSDEFDSADLYTDETNWLFDAITIRALEFCPSKTIEMLDQLVGLLTDFGKVSRLPIADVIARNWGVLRPSILELPDPYQMMAEQVDNLNSITLSTIHGVKGLEYRAVAIIGVNDGVLPDFRSNSAQERAEDARKFFVALTRALDYVLYISDREHWRNRPSPFLRIIRATQIPEANYYPVPH